MHRRRLAPDASARVGPKLRAGYLVDALGRLDGKPTPLAALPTFVRWVETAEASRQQSVGLGDDMRLRGENVIGSGLELGDELIQLCVLTSRDDGRRAFGRIARPSSRR